MSRIYELRNKKRWSQTELAELSGLSQNAISNYERGDREPGSSALAALARTLDCSADYLLGLTDDPAPWHLPVALSVTEWQIVEAIRADDLLGAIRLIVGGE